jgi:hypothetical protein
MVDAHSIIGKRVRLRSGKVTRIVDVSNVGENFITYVVVNGHLAYYQTKIIDNYKPSFSDIVEVID